MAFHTLIWRNVTKNTHTYGGYFLSSLYSVLVFFIFSLLFFHPQLQNNLPSSSDTLSYLAKIGMIAGQVVIVILSFVFLWYSFWNFIKSRKRDLGIYLMVGMSPKDLRKMLMGENLLIGTGAILLGLSLGTLFSKALLLVAENVLHVSSGLNFYFPWKGMLLTASIFIFMFLFISFVMTRRIETVNLTELAKGEEKTLPLVKGNPLLSLLGVIFLGAGYGSLYLFVHERSFLSLLLLCVLFTILGTFLLFRQISIIVLLMLKKKQKNKMGYRLLFISELIFQMRENAVMYALLALTASVAFVGIGLTSALGSSDLQENIGPSASYVLTSTGTNPDFIKKLGAELEEKITAKGYEAAVIPLNMVSLSSGISQITPSEEKNPLVFPDYPSLMKVSDYNTFATFNQEPTLSLKEDEVKLFAQTNTQLKIIQANKFDLSATGKIAEKNLSLNISYVPKMFNVDAYGLGVISDTLFEKINFPKENRTLLVDFKEWAKDEKFSQELDTYLKEKQAKIWERDSDEVQKNEFYFSSRYGKWQSDRQANGLIMMIGILLGGVFFIFAMSILSFRLFGKLTASQKYHQALDRLGVSPKDRHKIVFKEMLLMYFLPLLVAALHFFVAFWGLQTLSNQSFWKIYFIILAAYIIFQFIFFLVSYFRYTKALDHNI